MHHLFIFKLLCPLSVVFVYMQNRSIPAVAIDFASLCGWVFIIGKKVPEAYHSNLSKLFLPMLSNTSTEDFRTLTSLFDWRITQEKLDIISRHQCARYTQYPPNGDMQLHEKYKSFIKDVQMQWTAVSTRKLFASEAIWPVPVATATQWITVRVELNTHA